MRDTVSGTEVLSAWSIAAALPDPELPVVTIADLGILRDVTEDDQGRVHVQITPTYSGCPAMETIRTDLVDALTTAGYQHVAVEFVLVPAWTTDWMTDEARRKLTSYGIAPPGREDDGPVPLTLTVPQVTPAVGGGRRGLHTEELGYLLAEMQHLHRSHPGASW